MRAILVSVQYADLLAITLPYNRKHFSEVMVVTSHDDHLTQKIACINDCRLWVTDAFYRDGAKFNKWAGLEEAMDSYGRTGWLTIMDADVLWPRELLISECGDDLWFDMSGSVCHMRTGQLCSPVRRMMTHLPIPFTNQSIPHESQWGRYLIHKNVAEWAGYSQIFHAQDPHLPSPPWHDINWSHAGGADSFFQLLWRTPSGDARIRPNWECLHIGQAGHNWAGRVSPYLDGSSDPMANERFDGLLNMMRQRHSKRGRSDQFDHEKIRKENP